MNNTVSNSLGANAKTPALIDSINSLEKTISELFDQISSLNNKLQAVREIPPASDGGAARAPCVAPLPNLCQRIRADNEDLRTACNQLLTIRNELQV